MNNGFIGVNVIIPTIGAATGGLAGSALFTGIGFAMGGPIGGTIGFGLGCILGISGGAAGGCKLDSCIAKYSNEKSMNQVKVINVDHVEYKEEKGE